MAFSDEDDPYHDFKIKIENQRNAELAQHKRGAMEIARLHQQYQGKSDKRSDLDEHVQATISEDFSQGHDASLDASLKLLNGEGLVQEPQRNPSPFDQIAASTELKRRRQQRGPIVHNPPTSLNSNVLQTPTEMPFPGTETVIIPVSKRRKRYIDELDILSRKDYGGATNGNELSYTQHGVMDVSNCYLLEATYRSLDLMDHIRVCQIIATSFIESPVYKNMRAYTPYRRSAMPLL